jgi:hypothetical protein
LAATRGREERRQAEHAGFGPEECHSVLRSADGSTRPKKSEIPKPEIRDPNQFRNPTPETRSAVVVIVILAKDI